MQTHNGLCKEAFVAAFPDSLPLCLINIPHKRGTPSSQATAICQCIGLPISWQISQWVNWRSRKMYRDWNNSPWKKITMLLTKEEDKRSCYMNITATYKENATCLCILWLCKSVTESRFAPMSYLDSWALLTSTSTKRIWSIVRLHLKIYILTVLCLQEDAKHCSDIAILNNYILCPGRPPEQP